MSICSWWFPLDLKQTCCLCTASPSDTILIANRWPFFLRCSFLFPAEVPPYVFLPFESSKLLVKKAIHISLLIRVGAQSVHTLSRGRYRVDKLKTSSAEGRNMNRPPGGWQQLQHFGGFYSDGWLLLGRAMERMGPSSLQRWRTFACVSWVCVLFLSNILVWSREELLMFSYFYARYVVWTHVLNTSSCFPSLIAYERNPIREDLLFGT